MKKSITKIRIFCIALIIATCLGIPSSVLAASSDNSVGSTSDAEKLQTLEGKTAGVVTGTPQDEIIKANIKNVKVQYFNNVTDLTLALDKKKVDFISLPTVNYYGLLEQYPDLGYIDVKLKTYDVGTIFPKNDRGEALCKELNEYIAKIKNNGELQKLQDYWLYPKDWENIDIPKNGKNGIINMATSNTFKPFSFMLNDKNVGYDIAIIVRFCQEYGYGLNIDNVEFAGALSGIAAGKYDLAAGQISWTEERAKSVLYSDFYYTQKMVAIVNTDNIDNQYVIKGNDSNGSQDGGASLKSIGNSIHRTIIDENRWITIIHGLVVTLIITIGGFILANIMGAFICAMNMSKSKLLKLIARIYSNLMMGLPIVVILMILYYIIFAHSSISNVVVAIIGFGLVLGAYMAQLFEVNISGVDVGQREAALAMGLTRRQTFNGIVLPQAIRTMVPEYFSNLIRMMKGTAIVGYIAVTDLTKVGDIIRSSTYEAIVPLITIAVIYLLIATIMLIIMRFIQKKLTPKRLTKAPSVGSNKGGGRA